MYVSVCVQFYTGKPTRFVCKGDVESLVQIGHKLSNPLGEFSAYNSCSRYQKIVFNTQTRERTCACVVCRVFGHENNLNPDPL